jgi:hypothetical protein
MTILGTAAAFENFWVRGVAERLTLDPADEPAGTGLRLFVCMIAFTALLWTATVLSVYKPWGPTRWGRRPAAGRRGHGRVDTPTAGQNTGASPREAPRPRAR